MRYGFYIILITTLISSLSLPAPGGSVLEYDEVFLSFRHRQIVNTMITGIYVDGTIFLPVGDLFYTLQINHEIDYVKGRINGFFLSEDNSYIIDFPHGRAQINTKTFSIWADDFVQYHNEFFVHPDLFNKVFDITFIVNSSNLTLTLLSSHTMPVVERYNRRIRNGSKDVLAFLTPHAPLKYDRNRSWLNGGILDYRFTSMQFSDGQQHYSYTLEGGAELAGGDVNVSTYGGFSPGVYRSSTFRYRWRRVFDDNPYLTQLSLGEVFTEGLVRTNIHGVRLTNQPVEPRRVFSVYTYNDETEPGWDVELYINNRLYDMTVADEAGQYSFDIPLVYGSSMIHVKAYGPGGGFAAEQRRIEIPYTFLSPGEVHYNLSFGRTYITNNTTGEARAYAGISKLMSVSLGVDYYKDIYGDRPIGSGTVTLRPGTRYLVDIDIAPSLYYRARADVLTGMRSRLGMGYTNYHGYNRITTLRLQQQFDINGLFPITVGSQKMTLRFMGSHLQYDTRNTTRFSADAALPLRGTVFSLGVLSYHSNTPSSDEVRFNFSTGMMHRFQNQGMLRGVLLRSRFSYSTRFQRMENISVSIGRHIGMGGRVEVHYAYQGLPKLHSVDLQLQFDLPYFRAVAGTRHITNRTHYSQRIHGSIAYDSNHRKVVFNNRPMVGRGAASLRFFIDYDGSGEYDNDEPVVSNIPVRFRQAVSKLPSNNGIRRSYHLMPYVRYSVDIKEDDIPNPLWIPEFNEFSFIADPNSFKKIDIPLYVTGEIGGRVVRVTESGTTGIGGIRLTVKDLISGNEKTVRTFSDGTYYLTGLPPSSYSISINNQNAGISGLIPEYDRHSFTIEMSEYGDYVDGLDFVLRDDLMAVAEDADHQPDTTILSQDMSIYDDTIDFIQSTLTDGREYKILLGIFDYKESAERFINYLKQQGIDTLNVAYNRYLEKFAVLSEPTENYREAVAMMEDFKQMGFPYAKIVTSTRSPLSGYSYMVLLGEYDERRMVDTVAEEIEENLKIKPFINFIHNNGKFIVGLGPIESRKNADVILNAVQAIYNYNEAFLVVLEPDLLQALTEPVQPELSRDQYYIVQRRRGENLWNIAGLPEIYNLSVRWPKIWVANQHKIKNPDLIYPGQKLSIPPNGPLNEEERRQLRLYYGK